MGVQKTCSKCLICKSISCFYKQKNGLLGRTGECKECRKKRTKIWTDENRERKNEADRKRSKNIDRREYNKKWRESNPNYFKEYYKQNTEIRLEANRRFWKNHPDRHEAYKIYQRARDNKTLVNPGQCQMCGTKENKIQAHHFDYSKPLEVTWICVECHKEIHRKKKFTRI